MSTASDEHSANYSDFLLQKLLAGRQAELPRDPELRETVTEFRRLLATMVEIDRRCRDDLPDVFADISGDWWDSMGDLAALPATCARDLAAKAECYQQAFDYLAGSEHHDGLSESIMADVVTLGRHRQHHRHHA